MYLKFEIAFITHSANKSHKITNEFYGCNIFSMELSQDFPTTFKHSAGWLQMTITEFTTYTLVSFIVVLWCYFKWKHRHFEKVASKMKGPPSYPIIGTGLESIGTHQRKTNNNNIQKQRGIKYGSCFAFFRVL